MEEETQQLLAGIKTAHSLPHRLSYLNSHINQLVQPATGNATKRASKHPGCGLGCAMFFVFSFASCALMLLAQMAGGRIPVTNIITVIIYAVIAIAIASFALKRYKANKARKEAGGKQADALTALDLQRIETFHPELAQQIKDDQQEIAVIRERWAKEVAPWYPPSYVSIDAVDFFLNALRNGRVTNKQDMVNLYETECHQRRMEAGQQEMLAQQSLSNLLQMQNVFQQGQMLNNQSQILNEARGINVNTGNASRSLDQIAKKVRKF